VFFLSLGIELIPQGTCQNTGNVDINVYPNISGIDFKNGVVTFSNLYLEIDANESFDVGIFTNALQSPSWVDTRTTYDNKTGLYSLQQEEFPNGRQLKFSLGGYWTLVDDRLECGIAVGLNITSSLGVKNVYPSLYFPLQDDWNVTATITEATPIEASQYAHYGMSAINQSIASGNLTQFYVIKIDVIRNFNGKNTVYWIPPLLMLALLFVSLKLVREKDLENSLLVYVSVDIFGFGYILTLMNITPPVFTSIEILIFVDASLSFVFSMVAILRHHAESDEKENEKRNINSEIQNKNVKPMSQEQTAKEILDLIRLVDENKDSKGNPLFEERDIFSGSVRIIAGLSFFEILIWVVFYLGKISFAEYIALSFALLAVLIAFLSLISQSEENIKIQARFSKALPLGPSFNKNQKPFTESQKLILKALIKIRSKHDKFSLEEIYKKNQDMFTERRLMEILYN
jgi:hypothetical protein